MCAWSCIRISARARQRQGDEKQEGQADVCLWNFRVGARLKELSRKGDPICIFIDNWFVRAEWAGGSGVKGSGRKWWSETARAVIPCLMSWREIVSNGGSSQRDSLSDWPFTISCHIWPGNINIRPVLQHTSRSVWEAESTCQWASVCLHVCACTQLSCGTPHGCPAPKKSPFSSECNHQQAFVSKPREGEVRVPN